MNDLDKYNNKFLDLVISIVDPDFICFIWPINKAYDMTKLIDKDKIVYVERKDNKYPNKTTFNVHRKKDSKLILNALIKTKKFEDSEIKRKEFGFCLRKPFNVQNINDIIKDNYILNENENGDTSIDEKYVIHNYYYEIRTTEAKILALWDVYSIPK